MLFATFIFFFSFSGASFVIAAAATAANSFDSTDAKIQMRVGVFLVQCLNLLFDAILSRIQDHLEGDGPYPAKEQKGYLSVIFQWHFQARFSL